MRGCAAHLRLALLLLNFFGFFAVFMLCRAATLWREPAGRALRRFLLKRWAAVSCFLLGMRLESAGPAPRPPCFVVANHLSYADIIALAALLGPVFVAKGEMQGWPFVGPMMRATHQLFIKRESLRDALRVNALIGEALGRGDCVVMFPESGTSDGKGVRPFKPALIQPAVSAGLPVHYAVIYYETPAGAPPASEIVVWAKPEESFYVHLMRLLRHGRYRARIRFGPEPVNGGDRKELARVLHEAVLAEFAPIP